MACRRYLRRALSQDKIWESAFFYEHDEQLFMKYAQVFTLMQETQMSSEQLGRRLGISGMTLRRWRRQPGDRELPRPYSKALEEVICELAAEGMLKGITPMVQTAVDDTRRAPFATIAAHLGITWNPMKAGRFNEQLMIESISQIGGHADHREEVERSSSRILSFKSWGAEWKRRISSLMKVLRSSDLHAFDKLVAYGALFYLVTPIDLIPDNIPVFGYMDDFVILGFAVAYYAKRFPNLFGKHHE
jgi:uncharacterized membrane protein YkvA (DUF1232 family)